MPRWLRLFTFSKIQEYYDKQSKELDKANNQQTNTLIDKDGKVQAPEFTKNMKGVKYK